MSHPIHFLIRLYTGALVFASVLFLSYLISTVRRLANMACSTKIGTNLAQNEEMVLKPPYFT
mgnify:CR=1 FL=1